MQIINNNNFRPGGRHLSIRTRVVLAMCLSAVLVFPVVLLALYYVAQMNAVATQIAEADVNLLRLGSLVVRNLIDIRRAERNFLLSGDSAYLLTARMLIRQTAWACGKRSNLEPDLKPIFDSISAGLVSYNRLIDSLPRIRIFSAAPAGGEKLQTLQREHARLIEAAQNSRDPESQESLLLSATVIDREIELLQALGTVNQINQNRMQELFNQNIALGEKIVNYANQRIAEHKGKITRLFVHSQRNIITAILVLTALLIYLLIHLPNSIVLPIKRITNALTRAEQGDLNIHITPSRDDELGNLARQLNRVFARLRDFDDRKADYITELQRQFALLAANIKEGVLVVDRTTRIIHANPAMEPLLGTKASEAAGQPVKQFANLQSLIPHLEQVISGASSHQECEILPGLPFSAFCFEVLRNRKGSIVGALVIVTNPTAPETMTAG